VFFVQDDHDYYDNDEASDEVITFPPSDTMMRLARATQKLLYPEFLPDPNRPRGLPGTREDEGAPEISSNYGTLRYGKLLEVLLYDNRRSASMHGPTAVFVDGEVEAWLKQRMQDKAVKHVVNAPGLPPGWTKGNCTNGTQINSNREKRAWPSRSPTGNRDGSRSTIGSSRRLTICLDVSR